MAEVKRMTQTAIVKELAEKSGVNNKVSKAYLDALAALAVQETKKNGVFILPGLGRLVKTDRKARTGRNPATGQEIKIPAKKVVKFRLAKALKDAIVPPKAAPAAKKAAPPAKKK
jgi:DNA-binding protein HU-beta